MHTYIFKFLSGLIFTLMINLTVFAQDDSIKTKSTETVPIYISVGQDQTIFLKKNKTTKIKVVFYPKFNYKVEIIPVNPDLEIKMELFSEKGEKYFTNSDKNYIKFWHFCFQAITNGTIEISTPSIINSEEQATVKISYLQN